MNFGFKLNTKALDIKNIEYNLTYYKAYEIVEKWLNQISEAEK